MIKFLGNAAAILILMALSGLWGGYALTVLWGWFVVPLFDVTQIDLLQAIGLMLVVNFVAHQKTGSSDKEYSKVLIESYLYALIQPAVAILLGWTWLQVL